MLSRIPTLGILITCQVLSDEELDEQERAQMQLENEVRVKVRVRVRVRVRVILG